MHKKEYPRFCSKKRPVLPSSQIFDLKKKKVDKNLVFFTKIELKSSLIAISIVDFVAHFFNYLN